MPTTQITASGLVNTKNKVSWLSWEISENVSLLGEQRLREKTTQEDGRSGVCVLVCLNVFVCEYSGLHADLARASTQRQETEGENKKGKNRGRPLNSDLLRPPNLQTENPKLISTQDNLYSPPPRTEQHLTQQRPSPTRPSPPCQSQGAAPTSFSLVTTTYCHSHIHVRRPARCN